MTDRPRDILLAVVAILVSATLAAVCVIGFGMTFVRFSEIYEIVGLALSACLLARAARIMRKGRDR